MDTQEITAVYDLADKADAIVKDLKDVLFLAKELDIALANDAHDLYMRLRVVLGAVSDYANGLDNEYDEVYHPYGDPQD
jgi:hypothetical protein